VVVLCDNLVEATFFSTSASSAPESDHESSLHEWYEELFEDDEERLGGSYVRDDEKMHIT